jgi:hypothetical protein
MRTFISRILMPIKLQASSFGTVPFWFQAAEWIRIQSTKIIVGVEFDGFWIDISVFAEGKIKPIVIFLSSEGLPGVRGCRSHCT